MISRRPIAALLVLIAASFPIPSARRATAFQGDAASKEALNTIVSLALARNRVVSGIGFGVAALAWARTDGGSPLQGLSVPIVGGGTPAVTLDGTHLESNGAVALAPGSIGDPRSAADEVLVTGRIVTAQDVRAGTLLGQTVAQELAR